MTHERPNSTGGRLRIGVPAAESTTTYCGCSLCRRTDDRHPATESVADRPDAIPPRPRETAQNGSSLPTMTSDARDQSDYDHDHELEEATPSRLTSTEA